VAVVVTADVLVGGPLTRLDDAVSGLVRSTGIPRVEWREPPRARVLFLLVAAFGSPAAVLTVVVPGLAVLSRRRRTPWPLVRFVVLVVLVVVTVQGLKAGIGRPPPLGLGPGEVPRSYPSGHTVTAVTMWGLLAWTAGEHACTALARWVARALAVLPPVLTMVGMLVLDFHWLTDLVGGAAIGVVLLGVLGGLDAVALRHWPGARGGGGAAGGSPAGAAGRVRVEFAAHAAPRGADRSGPNRPDHGGTDHR